MPATVAKIFTRADGTRRVLLIRREDGNFGLVEQYWYQNAYEGQLVAKGWASLPSPPSIFETQEIAEREAKTLFPWIA